MRTCVLTGAASSESTRCAKRRSRSKEGGRKEGKLHFRGVETHKILLFNKESTELLNLVKFYGVELQLSTLLHPMLFAQLVLSGLASMRALLDHSGGVA